MCDQTPVEYKDGDIVWVKLGSCWWPGEVYDLKKLPEEVTSSFRKLPIAAVKFFDEEKYEYVKSIDKIYSYNCTKKNDFIKKGLSLYRSKKRNVMEKFPADVSTAEKRTNGDPNIIENPMFSPEERPDYTSIFGSSKSRKSGRKSTSSNNQLSLSFGSASSATSTPNRSVTHPRFIGRDDHEVRILVQTPQKPEQDEEEEVKMYECSPCRFKTTRINVIIVHLKSHVPGLYDIPKSALKRFKKSTPKRRKALKMTKSQTTSLREDLALIEIGELRATESSDEDTALKKGEKTEKSKKRKRSSTSETPAEKKEPERKDIRNDLLAEWDDDSDDVDLGTTFESATETSLVSADESTSQPKTEPDTGTELVQLDLKVPDKSKSCFDFEEEEEENEILSTSIGRKIPRVIPPTDWQKLLDSDNSDEETESGNLLQSVSESNKDVTDDPDFEAFKNILETTAVPSLPEIPQLTNFEQNLSSDKDELEDKIPEEASEELVLASNHLEPCSNDTGCTGNEGSVQHVEISLEQYEVSPNKEAELVQNVEKVQDDAGDCSLSPSTNVKIEETVSVIEDAPSKLDENVEAEACAEEPSDQPPPCDEAHCPKEETEDTTISIEEKPLSLMEESLLASIEGKPLTEERFETIGETGQSTITESTPEEPEPVKDSTLEEDSVSNELELKFEPVEDSVSKELEPTPIEFKPVEDSVSKELDPTPIECEPMEDSAPKELEPASSEFELVKDSEVIEEQTSSELKPLEQSTSNEFEPIEDLTPKESEPIEESILHECELAEDLTSKEPEPVEELGELELVESLTPKESDPVNEFEPVDDSIPNESEPMEDLSTKDLEPKELEPIEESVSKELEVIEESALVEETVPVEESMPCEEPTVSIEEPDETTVTIENEPLSLVEESSSVSVEDVEIPNEEKEQDLTKSVLIEQEPLISEDDAKEMPEDKQPQSPVVDVQHPPLLRQDSREVIDDSKPLNPKKRFVRTFEHFEQQLVNEQKRLAEPSSENSRGDVIEVSKLRTQLMEKIESVEPPEKKKLKRDHYNKPKSFRNLILERQREEVDSQMSQPNDIDLDLNEVPKKILDSPLHEEFDDPYSTISGIPCTDEPDKSNLINREPQEREGALNLVMESAEERSNDTDEQKRAEILETVPDLAQNVASEQEQCKTTPTAEGELNNSIEEYVQTCISASEEPEDLSALSTLAAVSELTTFHDIHSSRHAESSKILADLQSTNDANVNPNPTFVSEDDLANGQVEITSVPQTSKPVSLSSFSVDFPDVNETKPAPEPKKSRKRGRTREEPDLIERSLGRVFADEVNTESDSSNSAQHDIEDHIPSVVVCNASGKKRLLNMEQPEYTSSSKLLEILTDGKPKSENVVEPTRISKFDPKHTKFVIKSTSSAPIVEEVKSERPEEVSVQKISMQKPIDFEDIDAFIIQKPGKKSINIKDDHKKLSTTNKKVISTPLRGKAKILQQTIIKPASDTRTSSVKTAGSAEDGNVFDINSMPIVLSDQILTPENIENMPVVLSDSVPSSVIKSVGGATTTSSVNKPINSHPMFIKTYSHKVAKGTPAKTGKTQPTIISRTGALEKFIIVPSGSTATPAKTLAKRPALLKKSPSVIVPTASTSKINVPVSEPSGNKIMIVTNQQGQQSRVLLTPAQQKLIGYQGTGNKLVKSTLKGNILQKASIIKTSVTSPKPTILSSTIVKTEHGKTSTIISGKVEPSKIGRKIQLNPQKILLQQESKTIVIKNPQGQVVKKIVGSDEALLEQQVQEQVKAIKASGSFAAMKTKHDPVSRPKPIQKRSYSKKPSLIESATTSQRTAPKTQLFLNTNLSAKIPKMESLPPLTPISPKKTDAPSTSTSVPKVADLKAAMKVALKDGQKKTEAASQQKPVNRLIIRDSLGNQTTITEGQILAFPSGETVDGQTQSYMLVTLDEAGQLTPLNNEALLSLDPNLCLGGDLSNMVMQVESNALTQTTNTETVESSTSVDVPKTTTAPQTIQTVCNLTGSDSSSNQQFIITGDAVSTQKFLESLSEGNQDLANLLASAEGNILIQTDEQQILINTDGDNQLLLPTQEAGGPLFATQPSKSQDILAAALADTDVFQQDTSIPNKLSPTGSGLYPTSVANVLETTLSLSSPIMTPLEVPSTNTKKIPDSETDILTTEVPKNVDLPITITDPNITQTVSQQQLLANNLELPLTISDPGGVPLNSTEMNSPSFVYSLPSLDEQEDVPPKTFSGPISMPLLNEDSQMEKMDEGHDLSKSTKNLFFGKDSDRSFLGGMDSSNEELLSSDLCSSLSEPPPDMFDLTVLTTDYRGMEIKQGATTNMLRPELLKLGSNFGFSRNGRVTPPSLPLHVTSSPPATMDENSCEIPVQPPIVTNLSSETADFTKRFSNDDSAESDKKKIKFD